MLAAFNELVEQRIREAMRKGEFDGLPGAGRPLELDDDSMVPQALRVAYRILKNAGYAPPEVLALRDLGGLLGSALAQENADPADRRSARRLLALTLALEARGVQLSAPATLEYHARMAAKLACDDAGAR